MHEIILYYKYIPLPDAAEIVEKQRAFCTQHNLKGRIIIAEEGINGTLEGEKEAIALYIKELTADPRFADINIKKSEGTGNAFPKLSVKLRNEIVSGHLENEDVKPWETTGAYVSADTLNEWIENGEDLTIVDMRNNYEYKVGHFKNSINPGMDNFRDLKKVVNKLEPLKNKKIVTVCTGGVRCEKASGYLIKKGFENVYQLENGIVTYMEKYPGKAFKGKLYVFDDRVAMDFDSPENHTVVGKCDVCSEPTEKFVNCSNKQCNTHILLCEKCEGENGAYCGNFCKNAGASREVYFE
jgi:UPF0176 protein